MIENIKIKEKNNIRKIVKKAETLAAVRTRAHTQGIVI